MKKRVEKRQKETKLRKNFLPTLIIITLLWSLIVFMIYYIDPFRWGVLPLFFLLLFLASTFTFSFIFASSRRGLLSAVGITFFAFLRYLGVGNVLNALLVIALLLTTEVYFTKS